MSVSVMVFGGGGLRRVVRPSSKKKRGIGRLHVLRSTEFCRQICSGFQGRLGFPRSDDFVQRPMARRRLGEPLGTYYRSRKPGPCPARRFWALQSRGRSRVCVGARLFREFRAISARVSVAEGCVGLRGLGVQAAALEHTASRLHK